MDFAFAEFAIGLIVGSGLTYVVDFVWREYVRRKRRKADAPYKVVVGKDYPYVGDDLAEAKEIRAALRSYGYDAKLIAFGRMRN